MEAHIILPVPNAKKSITCPFLLIFPYLNPREREAHGKSIYFPFLPFLFLQTFPINKNTVVNNV